MLLKLKYLAYSALARVARLSTMYQKQNGLAMNGENLSKTYIIETKIVTLPSVARGHEKKGGIKNESKRH